MQSKKYKNKLFCFTHAGGTASFFDELEKDLPEYEFVKLEYAGHGARFKENFYNNFGELADDMFDQMKDKLDANYSLFGYSMGSISLVEVLKRIIREGFHLPRHIFLSAHEPHTKLELLGYTDDELDEWVIERTIEFGAIPRTLLNNKVFWRMYLPIYRADYSIIGRYNFEELDVKSTVPTSVFYSETDTPLSEIKLWGNIFVGNINYYEFEGNHFFIKEHHKEIAQIIKGCEL